MKVNLYIHRQTEKAVEVKCVFYGAKLYPTWLPKSQIKIEGDFVVWLPDWLGRKNGFDFELDTPKVELSEEERQVKYEEVIAKAKAAGIKGIYAGLRYSTILHKAKRQGIAFEI